MRINKKGFEFSFAWLFAILVGAVILFLAIYAVTKIIDTGGEASSAKTGKEIGVLLNPLETGFESGKTTELIMPVETIIYNECNPNGNFGKQIVRISQKNFGKWSETNINVGFSNKYIFSKEDTEGKNFFIFSKPFEFPFKVSDLIYLTSSEDNYCFIDAPDEIKEEINESGQENLHTENCPEEGIKICFSSSEPECEIKVSYLQEHGSVERQGEIVYFETDALMYGAIFSEPEIYECQIKRLMKRESELINIYNEKEKITAEQGCAPDVNILALGSAINHVQNSEGLYSAYGTAQNTQRENDMARCPLW